MSANAPLRVGDIVTCGRKGWWRIKEIIPPQTNTGYQRDSYIVELVMDDNFKEPKHKARTVQQWYVTPVDPHDVVKQRDAVMEGYDRLLGKF